MQKIIVSGPKQLNQVLPIGNVDHVASNHRQFFLI